MTVFFATLASDVSHYQCKKIIVFVKQSFSFFTQLMEGLLNLRVQRLGIQKHINNQMPMTFMCCPIVLNFLSECHSYPLQLLGIQLMSVNTIRTRIYS